MDPEFVHDARDAGLSTSVVVEKRSLPARESRRAGLPCALLLARILLPLLLGPLSAAVAHAQPSWAPITGLADGTVAENTVYTSPTPGVTTGTPTLTWSVEGDDGGLFEIDAATGVLTMVERDYERPADADADNVYAVTVKATDTGSASATVDFTVTVTDVTEPPAKPNAPSVRPLGGTVGALGASWTPPREGGGPETETYDVQWREGTTGGWTDGPQDWQSMSTEIHGLTVGAMHQVRVRATNAEGDSVWSEPQNGDTAAADAFTGRFVRVPGMHSGAVTLPPQARPPNLPITVGILFSEVPAANPSADHFDVRGATVTGERAFFRYVELDIKANSRSRPITIIPAGQSCGDENAFCSAAGASLELLSGVEVAPAGDDFFAEFRSLPTAFATGADFEVLVRFSHSIRNLDSAVVRKSWDVANGTVVTARHRSTWVFGFEDWSLTVRPSGSEPVVLMLGSRDCAGPGSAVCRASDGAALAVPLTGVVPGPSTSLIAAFRDLPGRHHGPFREESARVQFSQPIDITAEEFAGHSWLVRNGTATRASQVNGRSDLWDVWFKPQAPDRDMVLTLEGDLDCVTQRGAICTADSLRLANNLQGTMRRAVERANGDTGLLVGNRNVATSEWWTSWPVAQAFTTGPHTAGYDLNSVLLRSIFSPGVHYTVELWSPDAAGRPELHLTTLSRPSTERAGDGSWVPHYAARGTTLAPNTKYVVRVFGAEVRARDGSAIDSASARGWTLGEQYCDRGIGTVSWDLNCNTNDVRRIVLEVRGGLRDARVANSPPSFAGADLTLEVPENSDGGVVVGAVTATDPDADTIQYKLEGADAAAFTIHRRSGRITTRGDVDFNFEAKDRYGFTVVAEDVLFLAGRATVVVALTDLAEPPAQMAAPVATTKVGTTDTLVVTWSPPANTGPAISGYEVRHSTDGSDWTVVAGGAGTTTEIGSLTANTVYLLQVRATNDEGTSPWSGTRRWQTGNTGARFRGGWRRAAPRRELGGGSGCRRADCRHGRGERRADLHDQWSGRRGILGGCARPDLDHRRRCLRLRRVAFVPVHADGRRRQRRCGQCRSDRPH